MLIALAGVDGSGKTTQAELLRGWFAQQQRTAVIIKAYDEVAKAACRPFIETWTDDVAIMFLFQALHAQQYASAAAALKQGHIVIADRWDESYLAYHSHFGFLSTVEVERGLLNSLAFRNKLPDVGFMLDVPLEVAEERRRSRGDTGRFEDRPTEHYQTLQRAYSGIANERGWIVLDGTKTREEVHRDLTDALVNVVSR